MNATANSVLVGMGEMQISSDPEAVLTCLGLGSCIGLSLYDRMARVGGMAHIVLPRSNGAAPVKLPKFADTAVPHLIEEMVASGASRFRLAARIVGGAQMSLSKGLADVFKTGARNSSTTIEALAVARIPLAAQVIGGHVGRSMRLYVDSGKVTVTMGGGEIQEI